MNIEDLSISSKEAIRARMMQNAAKIWGLKGTQSIDPFVKLLMEAFSTEIFKVNNEVQTLQARILAKIAKMLTPNIYTFPRPAHAIAFSSFSESDESVEHLASHSEFFIKKSFTSSIKTVSDVQIDLPLTPIDHVKLIKAQVSIMLVGNTCYSMDEDLNKIPVSRIQNDYGTIVLGIDASHYTDENLSNLTLFCANHSFEYLEWIYKLLPYIKITNNNQELNIQTGLPYLSDTTQTGYEALLEDYSVLSKIKENIKGIYAQQFIDISGFKPGYISEEGVVPSWIASNKELENLCMGKKIIWLRMAFPPQFTTEILDAFSFALNAFPVFNRGWRQNESALDIIGNNIPLVTGVGEHFFYVEEVADGRGGKYTEVPFVHSGGLKQGLYTVRSGGMERFNERNAIDVIAQVLDLTRDEVSAFGNLDRDNVVGALKEMIAQMKLLDRKILNTNSITKQEVNYVIVEPLGNTEHLFASYWITHCSLANNLRSGSILTQQKRSIGSNRTITLLTETTGGEEEQKGMDAIQAYKYALTTRDKIISMEDIKNFCRLTLKDAIKEINIKRGTIVSAKPKEGFIRTLEIEIVPHNYGFMGTQYWHHTARHLRNQIALRAIDGIEYRVAFIDNDL